MNKVEVGTIPEEGIDTGTVKVGPGTVKLLSGTCNVGEIGRIVLAGTDVKGNVVTGKVVTNTGVKVCTRTTGTTTFEGGGTRVDSPITLMFFNGTDVPAEVEPVGSTSLTCPRISPSEIALSENPGNAMDWTLT